MSLFGRPERNAVAQQVADGLNLYQATMDEWVMTPGSQQLYDKGQRRNRLDQANFFQRIATSNWGIDGPAFGSHGLDVHRPEDALGQAGRDIR